MKHNSRYAKKVAQRKHAGAVHFQFPVDKGGRMTLNPHEKVSIRTFTRLRRADEIEFL